MWFSTEEHLPIHRRLFAFVRYSLPRNVSVESVLKSGVLCIPQQLLSSSVAVWASAVLGGHATSRWQTFMSFLAVHKYYLTTTHHDSTCARRPKRQNQGACEKMGSNNEEREWKEMFGAQFTVAEVWMTDRNRYDMIWQTQDMTRRQAVFSSRRTSEDVGETQQGRPGSENASVVGKRVFFLRQDLRHARTSECILKSSLALTPIDTFAGSVDKLGFFRK